MNPDACALVTLALVVSLGVGGLIAACLSVARDEAEGAATLDLDGLDPRPSPGREARRRARRQALARALAEAREASDSVKVSRDVPKIDTSRTKKR